MPGAKLVCAFVKIVCCILLVGKLDNAFLVYYRSYIDDIYLTHRLLMCLDPPLPVCTFIPTTSLFPLLLFLKVWHLSFIMPLVCYRGITHHGKLKASYYKINSSEHNVIYRYEGGDGGRRP
jgi:hypothetical protein